MKKSIQSLVFVAAAWLCSPVRADVPPMRPIDPVGDWRTISEILARKDMSPAWRDDRGYSGAYYQLMYGSDERAAALIAGAATRGMWIEGERDRLLYLAIRLGSQRVVAALIAHGDVLEPTQASTLSSLQMAAYYDQLEIVRMLLRAGVDVLCKRCDGRSPLETALGAGHWQMALLLDAHGDSLARYRQRPHQGELVFRAIDGDSRETLDLLHQFGFSMHGENAKGETPVEYAVRHDAKVDLVNYLIDHDAALCRSTREVARTRAALRAHAWGWSILPGYWDQVMTIRLGDCPH